MRKVFIFLILLLTATESFGCMGFDRQTSDATNTDDSAPKCSSYNPIIVAMEVYGYQPHLLLNNKRASSPELPITRYSDSGSESTYSTSAPHQNSCLALASAAAISSSRLPRSKSLPSLPAAEVEDCIIPESLTGTPCSVLSATSSVGSTSGTNSGARTPNNESQLMAVLSTAAIKLGYSFKDPKALAESLRTQLVPLARRNNEHYPDSPKS